jgi:hypothetical protein
MPTTSSFEAHRAALRTARLAPQDDGSVLVVNPANSNHWVLRT